MKKYSYFLFENFDAQALAEHPKNPRKFFDEKTDCAIAQLFSLPVGANVELFFQQCSQAGLSEQQIKQRIEVGFFREENEKIYLDCPVICREDISVIRREVSTIVKLLVEKLEQHTADLYRLTKEQQNGFSEQENLYHLLCGAVFDGSLFDCLEQEQAVCTSKQHKSGLDYLITVYEDCAECQSFSEQLLCSYNRFTDGKRSLESFGDANGNRRDFYRFFRLREQGILAPCREEEWIRQIESQHKNVREYLLDQVQNLAEGKRIPQQVQSLLKQFGYCNRQGICVPVFHEDAKQTVEKLTNLVSSLLLEEMIDSVTAASRHLSCIRYGASVEEAANETYHILFGMINEELVRRKIVSPPLFFSGEGRFRKCIWLV